MGILRVLEIRNELFKNCATSPSKVFFRDCGGVICGEVRTDFSTDKKILKDFLGISAVTQILAIPFSSEGKVATRERPLLCVFLICVCCFIRYFCFSIFLSSIFASFC